MRSAALVAALSLMAPALHAASINLAWDAPAEQPAAYRLYHATFSLMGLTPFNAAGKSSINVVTVDGSSRKAAVDGLAIATTHYFRIALLNRDGQESAFHHVSGPSGALPGEIVAFIDAAGKVSVLSSRVHYYVAPGGSDTAAGTRADAPFATLQKALDMAQPGDTIHLAKGVYPHPAATKRPGQAQAPITITGSSDAVLPIKDGRSQLIIAHDHIRMSGPKIAQGALAAEAPAQDADHASPDTRFISPALADGVNDKAVFGPRAAAVVILDINGKELCRIQRAGTADPAWAGLDRDGKLLPMGTYIARVERSDGGTEFHPIAIVK